MINFELFLKRHMEFIKILDTNNETDIFCFLYVSLDLITRNLEAFRSPWNNHKLSTEKNMTLNMLFTAGLVMLRRECPPDDVFIELVQVTFHVSIIFFDCLKNIF